MALMPYSVIFEETNYLSSCKWEFEMSFESAESKLIAN